mmetsp:Transcript_30815/g.69444  ORF Transcript_30815/g.69444 Transcript_30815/m.69444 type:complete len:266 (-) Transcript_30815:148-945(-)
MSEHCAWLPHYFFGCCSTNDADATVTLSASRPAKPSGSYAPPAATPALPIDPVDAVVVPVGQKLPGNTLWGEDDGGAAGPVGLSIDTEAKPYRQSTESAQTSATTRPASGGSREGIRPVEESRSELDDKSPTKREVLTPRTAQEQHDDMVTKQQLILQFANQCCAQEGNGATVQWAEDGVWQPRGAGVLRLDRNLTALTVELTPNSQKLQLHDMRIDKTEGAGWFHLELRAPATAPKVRLAFESEAERKEWNGYLAVFRKGAKTK